MNVTDFAALTADMTQSVPYLRHLGLEILEMAEGRAVVRLPDVDHLNNHVRTQHAGALFSLGEAARGRQCSEPSRHR